MGGLEVQRHTKLRSSLFWDVTQHRMVVTDFSGQPIGPTFKGQAFQSRNISNYHSTLRNTTQERGGRLQSTLCSLQLYMLVWLHHPAVTHWTLCRRQGVLPVSELAIQFFVFEP
jgi:hypothetical protein